MPSLADLDLGTERPVSGIVRAAVDGEVPHELYSATRAREPSDNKQAHEAHADMRCFLQCTGNHAPLELNGA